MPGAPSRFPNLCILVREELRDLGSVQDWCRSAGRTHRLRCAAQIDASSNKESTRSQENEMDAAERGSLNIWNRDSRSDIISIILYYTILYYTILYYTILYYTILYYTILSYPILSYAMLCYAMLYYTILYYTILYYTILYYVILGCHNPDLQGPYKLLVSSTVVLKIGKAPCELPAKSQFVRPSQGWTYDIN